MSTNDSNTLAPATETTDFEPIGSATYSPDDNKLRLYPFARLEKDVYDRLKKAGFQWAPKQQLFYASMWTPSREDILVELCGEIGDEDTSLVERAAERAERFTDYSGKRAAEAESAKRAVSEIADNIPLGQPILVGHHSEKHARRDAEKIENGMRRAVRLWDTSKYWQDRAKGALRHAKYKELPTVRHRRIKGLEADLRKQQKSRDQAAVYLSEWQVEGLTLAAAKNIANVDHVSYRFEGDTWGTSLWSCLTEGKLTVEECAAAAIRCHTRTIAWCERWIAHYENRLAYERAMLDEQGGITGDKFEYELGGRVLIHGEWRVIIRLNKKDGEVISVSLAGKNWPGVATLEKIKDYRPPQPGDAKKVKQAMALPPICNFPGEGFLVMTMAEFKRHRYSDFPITQTIKATEEHGAYRVRVKYGAGLRWTQVYITDLKQTDPPAPEPLEPVDLSSEPELPERTRSTYEPEPTTEFDMMREQLKSGNAVQVVSAPQLFPTPTALAERMVQEACLKDGNRVLEPSAGTGNILAAIHECHDDSALLNITAVEINPQLANALDPRFGFLDRVECCDFLGFTGQYERIIMNPPFANGQDVDHVRHAYELLADGGVLVAIMSEGPFFRSDRKCRDFRKWLDQVGGTSEQLPANTFETSGTGVNTRLVVVTK